MTFGLVEKPGINTSCRFASFPKDPPLSSRDLIGRLRGSDEVWGDLTPLVEFNSLLQTQVALSCPGSSERRESGHLFHALFVPLIHCHLLVDGGSPYQGADQGLGGAREAAVCTVEDLPPHWAREEAAPAPLTGRCLHMLGLGESAQGWPWPCACLRPSPFCVACWAVPLAPEASTLYVGCESGKGWVGRGGLWDFPLSDAPPVVRQ